ncbi:MAG: 16S rRNA (cytidine(1402)-2'-O)-methyltransferase [Sphaerochaetaceae bacterium]|nr:16S rRNA (cytidine(1402)-2'-O)-methyltransferase [Sphaerochaetaceae bacterium]MDC7247805.1 16S rRNA (cytidine(1402)-2'-O)-methyltransferase [Sphaerochaetaceae bacterium]
MGTLYIVATPIGNLEDITQRAVRILNEADIIACEDTRVTMRLLQHYGIHKRTIATHAHNEIQSARGIVKLLDEGNDIAFVSDAGTPALSDPGAHLVELVRKEGHDVIPVPGVSAAVTAVSVAGLMGKSFTFEGFLSVKGGKRKKRLQILLDRDEAFVLYESPYRLIKLLEAICELAEDRVVMVAREMTKSYEEYVKGTAAEVLETYKERPSVKGECVVCVYPRKSSREQIDDNH